MLEFRHAIILQAKSHRVWSRQSIEWSSSGHSAISYGTKHDRSGQNNGIRECFRGWDSNPKVCLHIFYSPTKQSKFYDCSYHSRYTLIPSPEAPCCPPLSFGIYHWHIPLWEKINSLLCSDIHNLLFFSRVSFYGSSLLLNYLLWYYKIVIEY